MRTPDPRLQQFVYMGMHGSRINPIGTTGLTPKQIEKALEEGRRLKKAGAACDRNCPYCGGISS